MYKIIICDDDKGFVNELKDIIAECNKEKRKIEFLEYYSGEELLENFQRDSDALFLDIQLEGMNGNEAALEILKKNYQGILVQCSGIFLPTPETVKISPYRYLLKQSPIEKTKQEIDEILEEMDRQKACYTLEVSYKRDKILVRTMDIMYITHYKKGSIIHLNKECAEDYSEGNLISTYSFEELMEKLQHVGFAIPHNSYIINMRYVTNFNFHKEIVLLGELRIPIARGKVSQFSNVLVRYMNTKYREKLK